MRRTLATVVLVTLLALGVAPAPTSATAGTDGLAVVALIDAGINPYADAFRDSSPLAFKHPSSYIPGYPEDAQALRLSLDLPYDKAVKKDAPVWARVRQNQLYWVPGTRIVGAISFGAGGTCPSERPPPVNGGGGCTEHVILDDHGHGTMTASRAAGSPNSLGASPKGSFSPNARIVEIEGLGAESVKWAADQGWIDVQSNSWLSLVPPPLNSRVADQTSAAFRDAAKKMVTIAASGNGSAYILGVAPTPTYALSTAPPGVILVGGHDNGKMTLWAGAPPHVVADAYGGMTAPRDSTAKMKGAPIACCTSAAAPYAAGGAVAIVSAARSLLGDDTVGITKGVIATGDPGRIKKGPLADGKFTLEEFKNVYFHTAQARPVEGRDDGLVHWAGEPRAPDYTQYGPGANPFCLLCTTTGIPWAAVPEPVDAFGLIGYGAINEHSVATALAVLTGKKPLPERAAADAQYEADQQLRALIFP
jgi:hypothetical protein